MVQVFELPADDEPSSQAATAPQERSAISQEQTVTPEAPKSIALFIGTPAFACRMDVGFVMSLLRLQTECLRRGIQVMFQALGNESLIPRARNILTEQFIRSECTHLLFLDADISFSPESIIKMLAADKDVVACLYPKKYINYERLKDYLANPTEEPVNQVGLDFNINLFQQQHKSGDETVSSHVQEGTLVRVLDAATGCLLIKHQVIQRMKEAYKDTLYVKNDILGSNIESYIALFDCRIDDTTKRYESEDYAFCRRLQAIGGEVWADISQPLVHSGFLIQDGDIKQRLQKRVIYDVSDE